MQAYIRILGAKTIVTRFDRMGAAAVNAKPAMEKVADVMMSALGATFESEGRRGGGSWARDTPDWLARKIKHGQDPRIGHATGALRAALSTRGAEHQVLQIDRESATVSTNLPYAKAFDRRRPIEKFTRYDIERMRGIVREHLLAAWGKA